ncbi:hypothetical protein HMPREF9446_03455 [Bacteroides fluxus YIT 12057]|uniref:Uncharacterized protein n=1 Tax=Bacteroides fluxus YIT 12057 TaxID=763034 RepID=F3PXF8_9BACE|nr:hypothetical protein HMPREF9446_03455 [Bacteroides fluxus YIT 12057]
MPIPVSRHNWDTGIFIEVVTAHSRKLQIQVLSPPIVKKEPF